MTFAELNINTPLLNALKDLGHTEPTAIQEKAYATIMSGKDVLGIAQTGTGKTFAYLLPCLRQWKFAKDRTPQILILVPTRELVIQVVSEVEKLTKYMNLIVVGVYGGVSMRPQLDLVHKGVDVIVATPGRLLDLALNGSLKTKTIKKLVIDEVDEMLNLGFQHQLIHILDKLPEKRQNLLFSATITEEVELLIEKYFNRPEKIEAAPTGTPLESIIQKGYNVPNFNTKVNLLAHLLTHDKEMTKVLVFAVTKQLADTLFEKMSKIFPERIGVIHSNKEQNFRFNAVKQFKEGTYHALIATDIVARGIDVYEVTHVINFDVPDEPENYMHRIGRTGRYDKKGIAITFVKEKEEEYKSKIEELMNYKIPMEPLPEGLEISDVLLPDEMPKVNMKQIKVKLPDKSTAGPAFHEKSEKNQKTNSKVPHKQLMREKYGKPQRRGTKPKR
jgi:ATP-dependent RNA helicase RhlE